MNMTLKEFRTLRKLIPNGISVAFSLGGDVFVNERKVDATLKAHILSDPNMRGCLEMAATEFAHDRPEFAQIARKHLNNRAYH